MPEMPEVETVVRSLRPHLAGRRIRVAEVLDEKLAAFDAAAVRGRTIGDVLRMGKEIVLDLSRPRSPLWLGVHLRMTGRLIYIDPSTPPDARHLRARFTLDRGALLFCDSRRFGRIRLADNPAAFAAGGVEILSPEFTPARLTAMVAGVKSPLKPWLLRQDRIVGFGNIYASEVCFRAGLDPRRPAGSLGAAEIRRLHRATLAVFTRAIECGGTTISDFADADGREGGYSRCLVVYGREGERCRRRGCGGTILRLAQAGRSTFFCAECQR